MTPSPRRARAAAFALAAALAVVAVPDAATSAPSARGSLSVTPDQVAPGQAVRFAGSIGAAGKRAVHLQWNMNRPGDIWVDVADTTHMTDRKGRFDFTFPAPSALGFPIGLRVVSGSLVTSAYQLKARPQEVTVSLAGDQADQPSYDVAPGEDLTVVVDTKPAVRSALGLPLAFPGRTVTLQQRVDGSEWHTVDSGLTDVLGRASFDLTAPATGALVLRAREERWTAGGDEVGWFPSFPTYFVVDDEATPRNLLDLLLAAATQLVTPSKAPSVMDRKDPLRPTASQTWGWGTSLWDYDWGFGEDFDSSPYRGTTPGGRWVDSSDGTGRVVPFNGGLVMQSKLAHTGDGDLGTTTAQLVGGSQAQGRWEFRLQAHAWEKGPRPYELRLELVPEDAPGVACTPDAIVVADVSVGKAGIGYGVRNRASGSTWTGRDKTLLNEKPLNMAVEVGKKHITWFKDGKPIGTVKGGGARLGESLVPRFSLVGQQQEMNGAQIDSDWQRMFSLDRGTQVKNAKPLVRSSYSDGC